MPHHLCLANTIFNSARSSRLCECLALQYAQDLGLTDVRRACPVMRQQQRLSQNSGSCAIRGRMLFIACAPAQGLGKFIFLAYPGWSARKLFGLFLWHLGWPQDCRVVPATGFGRSASIRRLVPAEEAAPIAPQASCGCWRSLSSTARLIGRVVFRSNPPLLGCGYPWVVSNQGVP